VYHRGDGFNIYLSVGGVGLIHISYIEGAGLIHISYIEGGGFNTYIIGGAYKDRIVSTSRSLVGWVIGR
jgi:hypothetical protein